LLLFRRFLVVDPNHRLIATTRRPKKTTRAATTTTTKTTNIVVAKTPLVLKAKHQVSLFIKAAARAIETTAKSPPSFNPFPPPPEMPTVCDEAVRKTGALEVPIVSGQANAQIVLGIINLFFFGFGTMIAGFLENDMADVLIGIGQLLIPFFGWIWSVVWGVLMLIQGLRR
jgi:hypothetical protein